MSEAYGKQTQNTIKCCVDFSSTFYLVQCRAEVDIRPVRVTL
jgi:hypothetical protein